ncbi:hypothetical protein ACFOD9_00305 [Novosphingobium bradum]|uniref:PRC-barrel domain-containing protein n=1 Tax=Novosphingobium bradum TaxID=1737444 RepID=A0ABV7IL62_9SPHN
MRIAILALALVAGTPALADAPAATQVKAGAMLRDATGARITAISRVNTDGSIGVIVESKFITIPADKVSVVDGKVVTKLTKREIISLR